MRGGSGDPARGSYCTNALVAAMVGAFDLDPFSNPRSHINATAHCMLEDGGDGFGDGVTPGSYRSGTGPTRIADASTRLWFQPDYLFVLRAYRHYAHTRWVALLRFDPRPEWFDLVYDAAELVCVLRRPEHRDFDPPPSVKASGGTFPHALYYRRFEDATPAVLDACISWRKKSRS